MKSQKYHAYIEYFLRKLDKKYNKNIILYFDEKCNRTNVQYNEEENKHLITYGTAFIKEVQKYGKLWRDVIRYTFAHELGHIVHCTPYETFKQKVEAEYMAERFALNYLKEEYPKTYLWSCKEGYALIHNPKWATCKSEKHYRKAFLKIREYVE